MRLVAVVAGLVTVTAACRDDPPPPAGTGSGSTGTSTTGITGSGTASTGVASGALPDLAGYTTTGVDEGCGDGVPGQALCFGARKLLDGGVVVGGLAAGDLDGDGLADGLVAAEGGFYIAWADGDGAVTFTQVTAASAATAVAPLRDGTGRVAVAFESPPGVTLQVSDASRNVNATVNVPLARAAVALAGADVTDDGFTDLLVAEAGTDADLLLVPGMAGGAFGVPSVLHTGAVYGGIVAGPLGIDPVADVVFTDRATNRWFAWFASEGGATSMDSYALAGDPREPSLLDATGDGFADVAIPTTQNARVTLFPVDAAGTAAAPSATGGPSGAHATVAGDFNGDGVAELAVGGLQSGLVYVFRADPDGKALVFDTVALQISTGIAALSAGDLTGDGVDDLLVAEAGLGGLWFVPADP